MKVRIETMLHAPIGEVWERLNTTALLRYVAAPLLRFELVGRRDFPARWSAGEHVVRLRLFGFVPFGRQVIVIEFPESLPPTRQLLDDGRGDVATRWAHLITLEPRGDAMTCYRDEVDVEAGMLTPVVWGFAHIFYRWRQARWRALARSGFAQLKDEPL